MSAKGEDEQVAVWVFCVLTLVARRRFVIWMGGKVVCTGSGAFASNKCVKYTAYAAHARVKACGSQTVFVDFDH